MVLKYFREDINKMLIKSYGSFWNPDIIDWKKSHLHGEVKEEDSKTLKSVSHTIDFWHAKGIYVLHSDFKTIYVGKAFGTSIGKRVCDHLTDRLAGRWDMFSWFSVSSPRFTKKDVSQPGQRQLKPDTIVDTLDVEAQ